MMGLVMSEKNVSITLFTECCAQNFFFTGESVSSKLTAFQLRLMMANPCLTHSYGRLRII